MEEQYQEFLAVVRANRAEFDRRRFRIFKSSASFGYKDAGTFGAIWASWIPAEPCGEILVDRMYSKTKEYKTFSGWLRTVEKNLGGK